MRHLTGTLGTYPLPLTPYPLSNAAVDRRIRLMRFLSLSDIPGHAEALSAVLATAERRGYTRVLVAGDICFPGPEPLRTWRRLSQLHAVCVQGVGDRALAMVDAT